jgi:hypothetical protein
MAHTSSAKHWRLDGPGGMGFTHNINLAGVKLGGLYILMGFCFLRLQEQDKIFKNIFLLSTIYSLAQGCRYL